MKTTMKAAVVAFTLSASVALAAPPEIRRLDQKAEATKPGQYPKEMVAKGREKFDGSFKSAIQYDGTGEDFVVGLWESGPGVLQTEGYPHDEYCLVLEGTLVVTNRSGTKEEFKTGDSFVIPKGWAGTWDMKTKFKKQYVAAKAS